MKKILIALCAVATLASCTKNEVLSYDQEAIGFDNAFVDNSTRSVVDHSYSTSNMFSSFQVYGFVAGQQDAASVPVFGAAGVTVTGSGTGNNANWTYDDNFVQYWIAGAIYNFSAVAPVTNAWTKTAADKDATTLSFTNDGVTDLLYAQNPVYTAKAAENDTVAFTFRHVLSKVKFSFVNGYNATNSSIRVKNIQITDAYTQGIVELNATTSNWTPVESSNNLTLNFGMATDDQDTDAKENAEVDFTYGQTYESQNELFMIPGAGQDVTVENADATTTTHPKVYTVKFTVELLVNGAVIKTYPHTIYTSFVPQPGKAYDLKAEIKPENIDPSTEQEEIQFTVTTITDWDNDHDGEEGTNGTDTEDNQVDTTI